MMKENPLVVVWNGALIYTPTNEIAENRGSNTITGISGKP